MARRAVGIVRVSQVAGREGESFASPGEQADRIKAACERDGLELVRTVEELDVSGGTPLSKRHGLRGAVEAVEAGEVQVIVAAYLDRLVRSLRIQEEVVSRVEEAGGQVMALDIGQVTGATTTQWLQGTTLGMLNEYQRRVAKERSGDAQARAVARGVLPFPSVPPGYVRGPDGTLAPGPEGAFIRRAFELRVDGATIKEIRAFLTSQGIRRSYHGVQSMLGNRVYLGEIHFGSLVNLEAHEPIVDRDLFERVQRVKVSRGRRAHSDRLLARLGVLRCGTCGSRMVVGSSHFGKYPIYRCGPVGDCPRRQTISAEIAERVVVQATVDELRDVEGRASMESDAAAAALTAEKAQADLDAAIRAFEGLESEIAAAERLREMRGVRDAALEEAHRLSHLHSALTVTVDDWDRLTLAEKRGLIGAVVERAEVFPGRGAGRIRVHLFGEESAGS